MGKNATSKDAKGVFDIMVRCVGERNPAYARRILEAMPGSDLEHKEIFGNEGDLGMCMDDRSRRLIIGDHVEMTMSARSFRIALAAVMAREALEGVDPSRLSAAPSWISTRYNADTGADPQRDTMQLGLYQFGDCVVAASPAQAAQLIASGPESAEGKAAVQAMIPSLGPCLQNGAQMKLTEASLAVALAEPLYFRAMAVKAGRTADGASN